MFAEPYPVALFPGSFHPIHQGHIWMAQEVLRRRIARRVLLVVSPWNPWKNPRTYLFSYGERIYMVWLATRHLSGIGPSGVEGMLPRPSYTIQMLREWIRRYPLERPLLIMGWDTYHSLPRWKESEQLRRFPIVVFPRAQSGSSRSLPEDLLEPHHWLLQDACPPDVSATQIRKILLQGKRVSEIPWREVESLIGIPEVVSYLRRRLMRESFHQFFKDP